MLNYGQTHSGDTVAAVRGVIWALWMRSGLGVKDCDKAAGTTELCVTSKTCAGRVCQHATHKAPAHFSKGRSLIPPLFALSEWIIMDSYLWKKFHIVRYITKNYKTLSIIERNKVMCKWASITVCSVDFVFVVC